MTHGMKVQFVTPYRVSQLQRYDVTVRGNVTSVYPPLHVVFSYDALDSGRKLHAFLVSIQDGVIGFTVPLPSHNEASEPLKVGTHL